MAPPKNKKSDREAAPGNALVSAPDGVTGAGVDGAEYQADEQGVIEVAAEHVAVLVERGFTAL